MNKKDENQKKTNCDWVYVILLWFSQSIDETKKETGKIRTIYKYIYTNL